MSRVHQRATPIGKETNMKKKNTYGFSLIEVLIAIVMFTILTLVATQTTIQSLRSSQKSDASTEVRQNLEYTLSVIERYVRNASSITSVCDGSTTQTLTYLNERGVTGRFICQPQSGGTFYMAKDSSTARLTSDAVALTGCSFTCNINGGPQDPPQVRIDLTAQKVTSELVERSPVTVSTIIYLRTY